MTAPELPPEGHDGPAEDAKDCRDGTDAASNDEAVHEPTDDEFADMYERGPVENLSDGVEVLVLRIFDEPHGASTHDTSATSEESSKLIPVAECKSNHN